MAKIPLYYAFGNHMHWVDMQWLWGYQVLPDSVTDMLRLCAATGARGCVNFDAVGYEKLAAEAPEALAALRAAVADGRVEVAGASYGQPYGLFQGGESNVRQLIHGARTVRRLLGVWPKAFWEEEFDFFPQLPQLLRGCGFDNANLFFQWTWHTPHLPQEEVPLILWEGADGTRIPALAKTALCLHQWPEDFDGILEAAARGGGDHPRALVQWLELMPSPDWMCRSELLLPRLRELAADPRFDFRPVTQSQLAAALTAAAGPEGPPARAYRMDEVWHGMSLGKNGDRKIRQSMDAESAILAAETAAALLGLCGRPYASWDVYPAWELDEAWRELLQAQHHDNHECEGLCGAIGDRSFERAQSLAEEVLDRCTGALAARLPREEEQDSLLVFNPCGWPRRLGNREVPACGWVLATPEQDWSAPRARVIKESRSWMLGAAGAGVIADRKTGRILEVVHRDVPDGIALGDGLQAPRLRAGGEEMAWQFEGAKDEGEGLALHWRAEEETRYSCRLTLCEETQGSILVAQASELPPLDPGFGGALELFFPLPELRSIIADTPYCAEAVQAGGSFLRKYPTGDWMTSDQWYEKVERPIYCSSFLDLELADGKRLAIAHDGSGQWFQRPGGLACVLTLYDPWDEQRWLDHFEAGFLLLPHRARKPAELWRIAQQFRRPLLLEPVAGGAGLPERFGLLRCEPGNVVVTAAHREHQKAAEHCAGYFGGGSVRNPFVLRLVELDGEPAEVVLTVPGPVAAAARTNLLGAVLEELKSAAAAPLFPDPPRADLPIRWETLRFRMRPREIATVMLDLEPGRHLPRHLDQHRSVWATAHKVGEH